MKSKYSYSQNNKYIYFVFLFFFNFNDNQKLIISSHIFFNLYHSFQVIDSKNLGIIFRFNYQFFSYFDSPVGKLFSFRICLKEFSKKTSFFSPSFYTFNLKINYQSVSADYRMSPI